MSKGSKSRVSDRERFRANHAGIDWSKKKPIKRKIIKKESKDELQK